MKRIIYDYESPHIVGKAKNSFPLAKVIVVILIATLAVALIYILFFRGSAHKHESKEYFLVVMGSYDSEAEASLAAEDIRTRGGGGYVYKSGSYNVVASVYKSEDDAKNVASRYGASVIRTGSYKFELKLSSEEATIKAIELCSYPDELISSIYELSVAFDKGELSSSAVQLAINEFIDRTENKRKELASIFAGYKDKPISYANEMYKKLCGALSEKSAYSLSSRLKYCLTEVTLIYKSFLISIS